MTAADMEVASYAPEIARSAQYPGVSLAARASESGSHSMGTHAPPRKDRAMPPMLATALAACCPRPICPMRNPIETAASV